MLVVSLCMKHEQVSCRLLVDLSVSSADADGSTLPHGWDHTAKMALIGAVTGLVAGLFGVGGGSVTVPALSLFAGMGYHQESSL
jgi:uncharacterized membrane protein YfcA